jgi:aminoglycoside/choline kinase family phosphotransferase
MDRHKELMAWTQEVLHDTDCYIKSASSDASFRSYWRVFSKGKTFIVMDAPLEYEDCTPFIRISNILHDAGLHVPIVIEQDLTQGFLLLSDLGTVQYLSILSEQNFKTLYKDALSALHTMQQKSNLNEIPLYNHNLLLSELELFEKWFVNVHVDVRLSEKQQATIQNCNKILINNALDQPQVFVHRDYHSRNLMKVKDNNPGILDFQDAVIGPVTYDLVSLLRDCYIQWDEESVNHMADDFRQQYNKINSTNYSKQQWQRWFDLMGLQRHLKVVGIFCRLNYRDNKPNYLKDLNLTLCYIKSTCKKYPEFFRLLELIKEISPSMDSLCKH